MVQFVQKKMRSRLTIFVGGFVLGAAFMASPAIGILLAVIGAFWLIAVR